MPTNLFALCKSALEIYPLRVRLEQSVQDQLEGIFIQQKQSFYKGIDAEVAYDGRWTPDSNELLTIEVSDESEIFEKTLSQNPLSVTELNTTNFDNSGIRALFTGHQDNGSLSILVQKFDGGNVLSRKFALTLDNNTFRRLSTASFILPSSLTFVIESGWIKFKSFHNLRAILNVTELFRAATEPEVRSFASHASLVLEAGDEDKFVESADEPTRKMINAVAASGVLNSVQPAQIQAVAKRTGLAIAIDNGRIVLPDNKHDLKEILRFLDESRYLGLLSGKTYIANSRRLVS